MGKLALVVSLASRSGDDAVFRRRVGRSVFLVSLRATMAARRNNLAYAQ
jgi:hypothetical protein